MDKVVFLNKSKQSQLEAIRLNGVYIGKIKTGNHTRVLYQVSHFYVEIVYLKYRSVIAEIHSTDSMDLLNDYIDQINIFDIVKEIQS